MHSSKISMNIERRLPTVEDRGTQYVEDRGTQYVSQRLRKVTGYGRTQFQGTQPA